MQLINCIYFDNFYFYIIQRKQEHTHEITPDTIIISKNHIYCLFNSMFRLIKRLIKIFIYIKFRSFNRLVVSIISMKIIVKQNTPFDTEYYLRILQFLELLYLDHRQKLLCGISYIDYINVFIIITYQLTRKFIDFEIGQVQMSSRNYQFFRAHNSSVISFMRELHYVVFCKDLSLKVL